MNVVLNVESLAPPVTGIGRYTRQLLEGLRKHSDIDHLACFAYTKFVDVPSCPGPASGSASRRNWIRKTLRDVPGSYRVRASIIDYFFRHATRRNHSEAIYHEPNYILKPFPGHAIATIHDLSHIRYPDCHPVERVRYLEKELPKTLERADHLITDSHFVKKELVDHFAIAPERITAIPLGVSEHFRPRREHEVLEVLRGYGLSYGRYLLAVATLEPRKNLQGLIKAYGRLPRRERKRFPLVFVGAKGWGGCDLEKTVSQLEMAGEARWLGYVPGSDLPALYSGSGAFAFPSFYEGFGLPPLEALASGVPVLTSASSAMAEVVAEEGILVDPEDCDSIYQGLVRLLQDDVFRAKARSGGPSRASSFVWEKCVSQTVSVYRKVKGDRPL